MRQFNFLTETGYDVYTCSYDENFRSSGHFQIKNRSGLFLKIIIGLTRVFRLYSLSEKLMLKYKIYILPYIEQKQFDYILTNDLNSFPIAFNLFSTKNLMGDFHEYPPAEFDDRFLWKILHKGFIMHQCRKYYNKLKNISTVCEGIADELYKNFGVKPVVITNASEYYDLTPSDTEDKIKLIHHGAAIRSRKIGLMIETMNYLDERFHLDLMLVPNDEKYYNELLALSSDKKNVSIISPVKFEEIIPFCNHYDIGFYILPFTNLNNKFSLPNKFFDFIQSRLAIITGPSPEMSKLIKKYELGMVTDTFEPEEIAGLISKLSVEQIRTWKHNSHKIARELSSVRNREIFLEMFKENSECAE